ncbi:MAG: AAA family ATPase [Thermoleophilia bacterium]
MTRQLQRPALVGRSQARALLRGLVELDPALPRVVVLAGEAGIGKSRLATACVSRAAERGRRVLLGHANPIDALLPLGVFRDALRDAARHGAHRVATDDPLARDFPALLLPELAASRADDLALDVLFEAAARYMRAASADGGLLVVLEDMHLAAPSSCALVRHLARTCMDVELGMLVTFRPGQTTPALADLRHGLLRDRLATEQVLDPLDPAEVAQLVTAVVGTAPSDAALRAIVHTSGGNPFAVEEVVREAVANGHLRPGDGAWLADGPAPLPWTVREMLVARLHALDVADQELLRLAAVIGDAFEPDLLAAAAGMGDEPVMAALRRMHAAGLVMDAPGDGTTQPVAFRHALTREAVLGEMLGADRAARHRRVLDALERRHAGRPEPHVERLLAHALGAGERERGLRYSLQAGHRARRLGAFAEADRHFAGALSLWVPDMDEAVRAQVLLEHGRMQSAIGDRHTAVSILEEARRAALRAGEAPRAALALAAAADARLDLLERERAVRDLERALAELEGRDDADAERLRVLSLLARAQLVCGRAEVARTVAERALPLATPGRPTWVNLRITRGGGMVGMGEVRAGTEELTDATRAARELGDDLTALRGLLKLAGAHADRLADAAGHADEAVALARRHELPYWLVRALWQRALVHVDAGEWDAADALAEEAERLMDVTGPDPVAHMGLTFVRGVRARRAGRVAEATVHFTGIVEEAARLGVHEAEREARIGLARTRLSAGDPAAAWEAVEPVLQRWGDAPGGPASPSVALLLTGVEIVAALGDAARAARMVARVAELSPGPRARYAAALADAASGRRPAEECWRRPPRRWSAPGACPRPRACACAAPRPWRASRRPGWRPATWPNGRTPRTAPWDRRSGVAAPRGCCGPSADGHPAGPAWRAPTASPRANARCWGSSPRGSPTAASRSAW